MLDTRNIIKDILSKQFHNESLEIEKSIYNLCVKLSHEYVDDLQDIYSKISYEKIGELFIFPDNKEETINDNINFKYVWESSVFKPYKDREKRDNSDHMKGIEIVPGEFKCKKPHCRSDRCHYYSMQTRSCDEPATIYVVCTKCGGRYTIN